MGKIAQYSDRVMLLDKGKLIDFDTPQKIFSREDLEEHGVNPPIYTQICKKLVKKDNNGLYPITLTRTSRILRKQKGNL